MYVITGSWDYEGSEVIGLSDSIRKAERIVEDVIESDPSYDDITISIMNVDTNYHKTDNYKIHSVYRKEDYGRKAKYKKELK